MGSIAETGDWRPEISLRAMIRSTGLSGDAGPGIFKTMFEASSLTSVPPGLSPFLSVISG